MSHARRRSNCSDPALGDRHVTTAIVERLTSNARNVALAEMGAGWKDNAELIVANTRAMRAALDAGDQVDEDTILAIHRSRCGSGPEAEPVRRRLRPTARPTGCRS